MPADDLQASTDMLLAGDQKETAKGRSRISPAITAAAIADIVARLLDGKRVRRSLPGRGQLHIDRQLPFLIVYRRPVDGNDAGTALLVKGEASYLTAPGGRDLHASLQSLVKTIAGKVGGLFGAFLVIEVWAGTSDIPASIHEDFRPGFRVFTYRADASTATVQALDESLRRVTTKGLSASVAIVPVGEIRPPGLRQLIKKKESAGLHIRHLGLEVKPVYRNAGDEEYPLIRRALHRGLAQAIKQGVFEFTRNETTHRPASYQSLGPRSFVKSVWQVDKQLAEVSNQFDFLLSITPTNSDAAWSAFRRSRFAVEPKFTYRPLPVEPSKLKRMLFRVPIERVSDPVLEQLFRSQQNELDRKLTMLDERGTRIFLYGSLMLYGTIDARLHGAAETILSRFSPRSRESSRGGYVDATEFVARANEQLEQYRASHAGLTSKATVREDMVGLMVSRGNLLIGSSVRTARSRVEALIAHEVGTHIVTWFNGKAQPFRQLYVGLPNYDELQEGLAVLAEYLVGGLSMPRMRLLAARVIAAKALVDGASFIDVFRLLNKGHGFEQRIAFSITTRIFRSGGYIKDAVYLRGLLGIMDYLKNDGDIEPLFIGKFGMEHLPIIKELQYREVLKPPVIRPHYLDLPAAQTRLQKLRDGISILDLVERKK